MINFRHDEVKHEFQALVEDKIATLAYRISSQGIWDYYSTYVPPEIRKFHIGRELVKYALDYATKNHYQIIPTCSFVKHFIDEHSEYESIVYSKN